MSVNRCGINIFIQGGISWYLTKATDKVYVKLRVTDLVKDLLMRHRRLISLSGLDSNLHASCRARYGVPLKPPAMFPEVKKHYILNLKCNRNSAIDYRYGPDMAHGFSIRAVPFRNGLSVEVVNISTVRSFKTFLPAN